MGPEMQYPPLKYEPWGGKGSLQVVRCHRYLLSAKRDAATQMEIFYKEPAPLYQGVTEITSLSWLFQPLPRSQNGFQN